MTEPTSSPPNPQAGGSGDPSPGQPDEPTAALWPPSAPPGAVPPRRPAGGAGEERDRIWVHFVWEALLFVGVVALAVAVWVTVGVSPVDGRFFAVAGALGLVATGMAFSLRAAVPNLAVGVIAAAAGGLCALLAADYDWGFWPALGATLAVGLLTGVVLAAVVVGLSVPAWAASLGLGVAITGLTLGIADGRPTGRVPGLPFIPPGGLVFTVFVLLSLGGGVVWLIPAVRRKLSGTRQVADPARYGGWGAAAGGALALVVSTLLATVAGVVMLLQVGAVSLFDSTTYLALAGVLVGGASIFGRRAGVAGTVLGVLFMLLLERLAVLNDVAGGWLTMVVGIAILLGLAVSRGMEAVGRKPAAEFPPAAPAMPWTDTPPGPFGR